RESLESRNFDVLWVQDGLKAYSAFRTFDPAICILDVMMPVKDGYALTEDIRKLNDSVPIIFLTAKSLTEDVVKGFELGGNDYLKKPFYIEELIVRINALLNRATQIETAAPELHLIGRYLFNDAIQQLMLGDEVTRLSYRESALLKMLVEHKNRVLDRRVVLENLWGGY